MRPKNIGLLLFGIWLVVMAFTFGDAPIRIEPTGIVPVLLGALLIGSGVCTLLDI